MSSFEWNKIIGAVLASMILAMVSGIIAGTLVKPTVPKKPAYVVAGAPTAAPSAAAAAPAGPEPIGALLAKADAKAGQAQTKICSVCHTFEKGQPNRIGPNLYNVVGQPIAEDRNGYQFSAALLKHKGQKWTVDDLNQWLWKPPSFADGTKMTFAGLPKAEDRANVIAYLNSLSDHPEPLDKLAASAKQPAPPKAAPPKAAPTQAAAPAAAGGGGQGIGPLLAKADPKAGEEKTKICAICHTFNKGGPNRIGPNLYNVVGQPIAEDHNGYQFSDALLKHKGQKWTAAMLNEWLQNPQHFAPGTKMTFAGLSKAEDRADVVAYLNTLSDHPQPLGK
jgi:cytochrome c